jgi:isochorismate synthase
VGGFAFDAGTPAMSGRAHAPDPDWGGFGRADWVLPELLWVQRDGRAWVTAATSWDDGAGASALERTLEAHLAAWRRRIASTPETGEPPLDPAGLRAAPDAPRADYVARVARALRAIAAGDLEKVVVARSVTVARPGGFDPLAILRALRAAHPSCAPFLVTRGEAAFVGASPERLVRRTGPRVDTAAVAGTAPRGRGPAEDRALARALVESKKEQDEHAVVVRFLRDRLAPFCTELAVPEAPDLLRLESIQHLHTPVRGRAASGIPSLLELAGALHPTPASGGAPQAEAVAWLARNESLERGWYAGPVGFVDAAGDGELWVALRSALLHGATARLFAGAGVVAGSDPRSELRETRLKLGTLLSPLLEL